MFVEVEGVTVGLACRAWSHHADGLSSRVVGQLTDVYLLALAVRHGGRLVTFDTGIPLTAVRKATTQKLLIL